MTDRTGVRDDRLGKSFPTEDEIRLKFNLSRNSAIPEIIPWSMT